MSKASPLFAAIAVVFATAAFVSVFAVGGVVASDAGPQNGLSDTAVSTHGPTAQSVFERHTGTLLGQVNETNNEETEEDQQNSTEQAQTEEETESEETEEPTENEGTEELTESEETEEPTENEETETSTENEETETPTETEVTEEPTQTEDPTEDEETETPTQTDEPTDGEETGEPIETEEPTDSEETESGTQEETDADDDDGSGDTDDSDDNSEDDTDSNRDDSDDSDNDGGSDDADDSDGSDDSQADGGIYDGITESDDNENRTATDGANATVRNGTAGGGAPAGNSTVSGNGIAGPGTETGTDAASTPGGQGSADLQVREASLSADWVRSGFNTTVRTTVRNPRSQPVNETLTVTVDGEPVATNRVTLSPEAETVVETEFEAVNGTVQVNGVTAGSLTVETQSVSVTDGDEAATTAAQGPGFTLPHVGVAVAVLALLGWTRRSFRRQRDH